MAQGLFFDALTGEEIIRDLTPEEIAQITETNEKKAARLLLEAQQNRRNAFIAEADPLFFSFQRGENTEQEWLDKVAEIRARYPYA